MNKTITYLDWKTGEEKKYILNSDTFYNEQLTKNDLVCSFDKTPLIFRYNDQYGSIFCPNCRSEYSKNSSQEEIDEESKKHIEEWKKELSLLIQKKSLLEQRINYTKK